MIKLSYRPDEEIVLPFDFYWFYKKATLMKAVGHWNELRRQN